MSDNEWTAERVAELRRLALAELEASLAFSKAPEAYIRLTAKHAHEDATQALAAFDGGMPIGGIFLSLLDALESARAERDEARETVRVLEEENSSLVTERDALHRAMRSNAEQIAENAAMLDGLFE